MAIETDIYAASKALTVAEQYIKRLPANGALLVTIEGLQDDLSDKLAACQPYLLPSRWFGGRDEL